MKRFKLRSNSIVDHTGALQHEIITIENKRLALEAKRKGLITWDDPNMIRWRMFILAFVAWQMIFAPLNWAFSDILLLGLELQILELISDGCFFVDFFLKFLVARKDKRTGLLITKKRWECQRSRVTKFV